MLENLKAIKSNRRKWISALRSGRYAQGAYALKRTVNGEPSFCCLGVLCDVLEPEKWHGNEHLFASYIPAYSVLDRVGLSEKDAGELSIANDAGVPFTDIAGLIENQPID